MIDKKLIREQIRKRLLDAIKQSGLTHTEIAKRANISIAMLTDYKTKNKLPDLINLSLLCEILDVSADEILGLSK